MLRTTWWFPLAALGGFMGTSGVSAQVCERDDQCPTSTYCAYEGVGKGADDAPCIPGDSCGERPADPLPAGTCKPLPAGACEVPSDCAEGRECVKGQYVNPCAGEEPRVPGEDGAPEFVPPECDGEVHTARYGTCEAPAIPCERDDQCPLGLTCSAGSGSSVGSPGSSGGDDLPVSDPAAPSEELSYCGYEPRSCAAGEACDPGFECAEQTTSTVCTVTDLPCIEGMSCDAQPAEPECETEVEKICLPSKDLCEDDSDCSERWKCVEFGAEGGPEAPDFWNETGIVKSCIPEGLASIIEDGFSGGGGVVVDDEQTGVVGEAGGPRGEDASAGSSSGCAVGTRAETGSALGALALGLVLARRRRRRA